METLRIVLQIIAGLGILNVWLLRAKRPTAYRGGKAANMKEEFAVYGLPEGSVWIIGGLKILFALGLLVGIAFPVLVTPSAIGLGVLMLGAVAMHLKVRDPAQRSIPALILLAICILIILL